MGLEQLPRTISIENNGALVRLVDQTKLPQELVMIDVTTWESMVDCIKRLVVRGAPALGVAGAAALTLYSVNQHQQTTVEAYVTALTEVAQAISEARPTAVNLSWGVFRAKNAALAVVHEAMGEGTAFEGGVATVINQASQALLQETVAIADEDEEACRTIGRYGAELLPDEAHVLTHCNAGSLATAFYGTALGVIYAGFESGKVKHVYADETRPIGQGSRLTVWELSRAGVPATLLCDNMAASLMAQGKINAVIVGADRICANGDVANKIGTYGVAVLAHYHNIPFYVAAPYSTIDMSLETGADIEIEHRAADEVSSCIPEGVSVYNPAFDVTPASLITAIVTNQGVYSPAELRDHF